MPKLSSRAARRRNRPRHQPRPREGGDFVIGARPDFMPGPYSPETLERMENAIAVEVDRFARSGRRSRSPEQDVALVAKRAEQRIAVENWEAELRLPSAHMNFGPELASSQKGARRYVSSRFGPAVLAFLEHRLRALKSTPSVVGKEVAMLARALRSLAPTVERAKRTEPRSELVRTTDHAIRLAKSIEDALSRRSQRSSWRWHVVHLVLDLVTFGDARAEIRVPDLLAIAIALGLQRPAANYEERRKDWADWLREHDIRLKEKFCPQAYAALEQEVAAEMRSRGGLPPKQ